MSEYLKTLAREGKINENASMRDRQSVIINNNQANIWKVLTDVSDWPSWNQDISKVKFDSINEGANFSWKLSGTTMKSTFQKIDEPNLLAWTGKTRWIKNIHVWKLEQTDEDQTIVSAEESMQGFLTPLVISHYRLHQSLLNWLSRLKHICEGVNSPN